MGGQAGPTQHDLATCMAFYSVDGLNLAKTMFAKKYGQITKTVNTWLFEHSFVKTNERHSFNKTMYE